MNIVAVGLVAQVAFAVLAILGAWATAGKTRNVLAGSSVAASGVAALVTGIAAVLGNGGEALIVRLVLPLVPGVDAIAFAPDPLGGVFVALAGGVLAVSALFGIGYALGPAASRTAWTAFAAFGLGVQLVPAAADAGAFLLAWEAMAASSTVLLLADHASRRPVRAATLWYAVMTHLSFLLILAGFGVLASASGGISWDALSRVSPTAPSTGLALGLLLLGFATKAGLVPVHVWLPLAHPEAPSHMSAAMSAAMVKMGVYGMLLLMLRLVPGAPLGWALALVIVGAGSALYGILQASVQADLKRLLAYSTTENVGLIVTALGVGLLLRPVGQVAAANVALVATLLLTISHAAFKSVLFLGAGSVLHTTGERDLDLLGGLASRMPWTSVCFGVGALGAAALPISSGFVAEWSLLQAVIHGRAASDRLLAVAMPVTMAVVALTIGLGLLTFVKAFGIGFLARPRSDAAASAHEGGLAIRAALVISAAATLALGLFPGPVATALARTIGASGVSPTAGFGLSLDALGLVLDPVALTLLAAACLAPLLVVQAVLMRRAPRRDVAMAWGCGGERTSPRMEYNATSYSEPLVRVFRSSLGTHSHVEVVHPDDAPLLVKQITFEQDTSDVVQEKLYQPAASVMLRLGDLARRVQNGSIHRYVAFSFGALVLVLLLVAR